MITKKSLLSTLQVLIEKEGKNKDKKYRYFSNTARQHSLCFFPIITTDPYSALYKFIEKEKIDVNQFDFCEMGRTDMEVIEYLKDELTELEYKQGDKKLEY